MKKQVTVHVNVALTIMLENDTLDDKKIEDMVDSTMANLTYDFSIDTNSSLYDDGYVGSIVETEIIGHELSHVVDIPDEVTEVHDVDVISVDDLEEEFKVGFTKPWAIQFADGSCLQYDTEDDACKAQRDYRTKNGLDPMTGEMV